MTATTGLGALPEIIAIAEGSPAKQAGLIVGDRILSAGEQEFSTKPRVSDTPEFTIIAQSTIDGESEGEPVSLRILRGTEVIETSVRPAITCAGYTALLLQNAPKAFSDSNNIAITTGLVEFIAAPDELAFVIGHELAHTIYQDSENNGLSRREKERRADLFATHINRCLALEAQAGPDLLRRLDAYDWQSWMPKLSHSSTSKRSAAMDALPDDLSCSDRSVLDYLTQNARS